KNVLTGAVFVEIAGDAERGQRAHFVGVRDRAAENQNREPAVVQFPDGPDQIDTRRVWQAQVEHHEINARQIGLDAGEEFRRALDDDGLMSGILERRAKPVADKGSVVSDKDGLGGDGGAGHWDIICVLSRSRLPVGFWHVNHPLAKPNVTARVEDRMAPCPQAAAEIEVDEFDVDKGDQISCPECGSNLEVTSLSPIELDLAPEDDEDDEDDDEKNDEDETDDDDLDDELEEDEEEE